MATAAQSKRRGPLVPAPTFKRCHASAGARATKPLTRRWINPVHTLWADVTAITYGCSRSSKKKRSLLSAPYTESATTQAGRDLVQNSIPGLIWQLKAPFLRGNSHRHAVFF